MWSTLLHHCGCEGCALQNTRTSSIRVIYVGFLPYNSGLIMENDEKLPDWLAHVRSAHPHLSPSLKARVLAYRAAMGADVGNRLLIDMGLRPIPRRVTKSGPTNVGKLCRRLIREQGKLSALGLF